MFGIIEYLQYLAIVAGLGVFVLVIFFTWNYYQNKKDDDCDE